MSELCRRIEDLERTVHFLSSAIIELSCASPPGTTLTGHTEHVVDVIYNETYQDRYYDEEGA